MAHLAQNSGVCVCVCLVDNKPRPRDSNMAAMVAAELTCDVCAEYLWVDVRTRQASPDVVLFLPVCISSFAWGQTKQQQQHKSQYLSHASLQHQSGTGRACRRLSSERFEHEQQTPMKGLHVDTTRTGVAQRVVFGTTTLWRDPF
jgi:hypothetical protein